MPTPRQTQLARSSRDLIHHRQLHLPIPGKDNVNLNVAVGGQGPAIVLLHGFPQTHYMWRTVAQLLAAHHTVIAPDLRGYGKGDKPIADDPATYSKRTMGDDIVHITRSLGIHRFGVVGRDRGALVAVRAGLDHPEEITFLGILDVLPTLDTWAVLQGSTPRLLGTCISWPSQPVCLRR